jgi:iron complex transport system permease protein
LADPYIIGTSSGASLGAVISVILHISWVSFVSPMILFAFLGASCVMLFVYNVSVKMGKLSVENFLLSGVIAGSFCSALVSFLMMFSGESLPHIVMWLMGGFSGREEWNYVLMLLPYVIVGFIFLLFHSPALNLLSMGEDIASSRGVNVEKEKLTIIAFASLITSVSVSIAGTIGFIGFMIPHIMRKIFGSEHRILIISSLLGGAIFLTLADMLARSILPQGAEIPVGVITSLIGAPFFFFVLKKR